MEPWRFLITGGSQGIGAAIVDAGAPGRPSGRVHRPQRGADRRRSPRRPAPHGLRADVSVADDNARTVEACRERMGGVDVLDQQRRLRLPRGDRRARRRRDEDDVRDQRVRAGRHHQPRRAADEGAGAGRHRQHRVDVGHEGRARPATPYGASKWAVRGISQCWQAELRPHGIRVTCVCPSEVQTNFGGRSRAQQSEQAVRRRHRARRSWPASTCRAACCGRSWPCSPTTRGRKTETRTGKQNVDGDLYSAGRLARS